MVIGDISQRDLVTCERDSSVQEVAALMRLQHVGDVVIVETENGVKRPIGIVTDRDLVIELLATEVDTSSVCAGDVMSQQLVQVNVDDDIPAAIDAMRDAGVRRMPVVDTHGALVGIVTVDDLIGWLAGVLKNLGRLIVHERDVELERRSKP